MYLNLGEEIAAPRRRWSPLSPPTAGSCPAPASSSLSQPPPQIYDFYRAPFADFPIIQSHVCPFCIIYNAGKKTSSQTVLYPSFSHQVIRSSYSQAPYDQFTAPPPPAWGRDISIAHREPPSDEGGSRKRSRRTNDSGPPARRHQPFAKTSRSTTQITHTTNKADRGRRHGVHASMMMRIAPTLEHISIEITNNSAPCGDCSDRLPRDLKDWMDGAVSFVACGEGNALLLNDHQICCYVRE